MNRLADEGGQTLATALLFLPIMLLVFALVLNAGLAVEKDLALQGATEAAALAATNAYSRSAWQNCQVVIDQGGAETWAKEYLQKNLPSAQLETVTVTNAPDGSSATVMVQGTYVVSLLLPGVLGTHQVTVSSLSQATLSNGNC